MERRKENKSDKLSCQIFIKLNLYIFSPENIIGQELLKQKNKFTSLIFVCIEVLKLKKK